MEDVGLEYYLMNQMELKREEMIEAAELYGFTSEKTVTCSQELDRLMNTYLNMFAKRKKYSLKYAN